MLKLLPLDDDGRARQQVDLARTIVATAADAIFVMDAKGRIAFANPAAERIFGWRQADLLGKVLHDVLHATYPDGRRYPRSACPLIGVFTSRTTLQQHEDVFFRRDGTPVHVVCSNAPILQDGQLVGAVLVVMDITARKQNEAALAAALAAKEALLKEVNHRTKNSLMLVASLLQLQSSRIADKAAQQPFLEACGRIATVARIHERLYRSDEVRAIEFGTFLRDFCDDVGQTNPFPDRVALRVEAQPMVLATDHAVPLALIVNELITNALKHAFVGGRSGSIRVAFGPVGSGWELHVSDDGVGLPEGFDPGRAASLGMRLVVALAQQLGAHLTIESDGGAAFILRGTS